MMYFTIASLLCTTLVAGQSWPNQTFVTEKFQPPVLEYNKTGQTADGYFFFAALAETTSANPLIMTETGQLIWQSEMVQKDGSYGDNKLVYMNVDLQQMNNNETYLTYYNGTPSGSHAYGSVYILDDTYSQAYHVCLQPGNVVLSSPHITPSCFSDMHESQFTDRGTILLTLYNTTRANLSSVGGSDNGWILDSQFYEVDIATNDIVFSWKSLDHLASLPLNSTHYPIVQDNITYGNSQYTPFDWFHINSIEAMPSGGYLISSRHLWDIIAISPQGDVEWVLPGNRQGGSFSQIDPNINFAWQHHARIANVTAKGMVIHFHNNNNSEVDFMQGPTSGLLVSLNLANASHRTATLLDSYTNPADVVYSFAEGSYQTLPNGNVLLGHGYTPTMVEFSAPQTVVYSAQFGPINFAANSYRNFRYPWIGQPTTNPKAQFANASSIRYLYMSWNGATQYNQWMVYAGSSASSLKFLGNVTRSGFETNTTLVQQAHGYAQVKAVGQGKVLGQSPVFQF